MIEEYKIAERIGAGVKFGAIEFDAAPIIALIIISIYYGITIPLMYWVNEKLVVSINL